MSIARKITSLLEYSGDPETAIKWSAYMRNKFEFYGVSAPIRKQVLKEQYALAKNLSHDDLIQEIDELWSDDHRECQYAAMDILFKRKKNLVADDFDHVMSWVTTKSWWDTVDGLVSHLVGILFQKYPELKLAYLPIYLDSDNIWLNRTCLIYQLKYGRDTDFEELKKSILYLKHKNEFFVQKAIGWSLRQYSKFEPDRVIQFVGQHDFSKLVQTEGLKHVNKSM